MVKATTSHQAPLSYVQERLWFLAQAEDGNPAYNRPYALRLRGGLDISVLTRCLDEIARRHQILRSTFQVLAGRPMQLVQEVLKISIGITDLTGLTPSQKDGEAQRQAAQKGREQMDLSRGPLLRVQLLKLADNDHVLLILMHHIVTDAWSMQLVRWEFSALYDSYARGEPSPFPELPLQYGEFAAEQRKAITRETVSASLVYWKSCLQSAVLETEIYPDRPRLASRTFAGAQASSRITGDLVEGLRSFSLAERATPQMTTLAGFAALLQRYTSQDDIVIGTFVAGRRRPELESLIGPFINTIPLRIDLSGDPSFRLLLRRVRKTCLEAYQHADVPFEVLLQELRLPHNPARTPLFQAVFNYEKFPVPGSASPILTVEEFPFARGLVNFELTMELLDEPGGLSCDLQWNEDLFAAPRMQRMSAHYQRLLEAVVANPDQALSQVPLLSPAEQHQVLVAWNDTRTDYPRAASLHRLFEAQAECTPDRVAAELGDERVSYRELNARANQMARFLRRRGIKAGDVVAMGVEPSVDMLVVMLGILKAGGLYLPLTPLDPKDRTSRIVRDARAAFILASSRLAASIPADVMDAVYFDVERPSIQEESDGNLEDSVGPEHLACIVYTSGSTGDPKGVSIPHRAIIRLARNTNFIRIDPEDRIGQASNVAFDAVSFEIWGALLNGACLVEVSREIQLAPEALAAHLQGRGITVLFLTTSLFNWLASHIPAAFKGIRCLMIGGEAADAKWIREVLACGPPRALLNMYGPTESGTFATWYEVREVDPWATTVPIGRPVSNTEIYILDPDRNPVPAGVAGEIHIGGDGLALGYVADRKLTEERFVPNPFDSEGRGRIYRTGDWGRFRDDGNIEFLGRKDDQVKVRGFRVELGEIGAALSRHPAIQESAVIAVDGPDGVKRIIAYIIPKAGAVPRVEDVLEYLRSRVPSYMLPASILPLERLPVTRSGKLDREALPAPDIGPAPAGQRQERAPDEIETRLLRIWEEVLGVAPSGIHDDFFELGGHSILGAELCVRIEQALGKPMPVACLFAATTVAQQAELLRRGPSPAGGPALPVVNPGGSRRPLFFAHGIGGQVLGYSDLARRLGADQPVYGLQAEEGDSPGGEPTIELMASTYIRKMRMAEPVGPYLLGGHSFGGFVAFEMARQLSLQGERIALLALIDTRASGLPSYPSALPALKRVRYFTGILAIASRFHLERVRSLSWIEKLSYVLNRFRKKLREVRKEGGVDLGLDHPVASFFRETVDANLKAVAQYRPSPYSGKVTLFRAQERHPVVYDRELLGWSDLALGGVEVCEIPGDHMTMLQPPNLEILVDRLRLAIRAATPISASKGSRGCVSSGPGTVARQ